MRPSLLLSFFILIFCLISCEESEEGCLDFFANNYNFDAVTSCDSCCTYPLVNFDFELIFNDEVFNINRDTFFISGEDTIVLKRLEIVFSDFEFVGDAGTYVTRDTLQTSLAPVRDDFVFYKTSASKSIGRTRFADTIRTVNCRLGFDQDLLSMIKPFSGLDQSAKIDEALDSLYSEDTNFYLSSRINFQLFDSIRQIEIVDPFPDNMLSYDVFIPVNAGVTWTIDAQIDILKLLSGINATLTNEEITAVLSQNLSAAVSIE